MDPNDVQMEDGMLRRAQNAIHDPTGAMGGLRKRPGLIKVNSSAVSGSVFGICNVPLAPITLRRFLIGIDQSITTTHQWITSTDGFGTVTTATTPAATAKSATIHPILNSFIILTSRGCSIEQLFIYPGDYTRGNPQPVRAYDGTVDRELFKVPLNAKAVADVGLTAYAAHVGQILDWLVIGTKLYFVSLDYIHIGTYNASTVFEYDTQTGGLQQIGEGAGNGLGDLGDGGVTFTCLGYHQGYLYAGVGPPSGSSGNSTAAGVYRIRPGDDTVWTYDFDNSGAGDADNEAPLCMASYKGLLYVGMIDFNSSSARMMVRSAAGAYSSSTTVGSASGSAWTRAIVFGDNLYACAWDNNGAASITTIRKFDGSSWTIVKTIDTATADCRVGVEMIVHNGILYVLAIDNDKNAIVTRSADGTSWTDQTSQMTGTDVQSVFGVFTD